VDLLDLIVLALRIVLVALLYLFLVIVLRTAAIGLRSSVTYTSRSAHAELQLRVIDAGGSNLSAGELMRLVDGATLGRAAHADLVIVDPAVSAEHARFDRVGRAWVLTDLGSTNGTRVNDSRVNGRTPLAEGDVVVLGTVRLQIVGR
jgi:hypothetical protein